MFEHEILLVSNYKAMRIKPFVAKVNLNTNKLEFLRAKEAEFTPNGVVKKGIYEFENGNFYIILRDFSSHRNKDVYYTLYLAVNNKLQEIARLSYYTGSKIPKFSAIDDETKKVLVDSFHNATNNKTINALIKVARYYAQKLGISEKSKDDLIREEIILLCKKYNITVQELIKIAQSL